MIFRVDLSKVKMELNAIGYYLKTLPPLPRILRRLPYNTEVNVDVLYRDGKKVEEAIINVPLDIYRRKKLFLFDVKNTAMYTNLKKVKLDLTKVKLIESKNSFFLVPKKGINKKIISIKKYNIDIDINIGKELAIFEMPLSLYKEKELYIFE